MPFPFYGAGGTDTCPQTA